MFHTCLTKTWLNTCVRAPCDRVSQDQVLEARHLHGWNPMSQKRKRNPTKLSAARVLSKQKENMHQPHAKKKSGFKTPA